MAEWWNTSSSLMRTRRFSRNSISSRARARADFHARLAPAPRPPRARPARPRRRRARWPPRACSSSWRNVTWWPRVRTISPSTARSLASASRASSRNGGAPASSRARRSCRAMPGCSGFSRVEARAPPRTSRSRADWNQAGFDVPGMRRRAAGPGRGAISSGCNPVRATRSATLMPKAASRTSRATRAAASGRGEHVQPRRRIFRAAILPFADIHHHSAADGHHRREHADDEAVAGQQQRRLAQHQPRIGRVSPACRSGAAPPSSRTSASISAVPEWKCTGARCFSGLAEASSSRRQSMCRTALKAAGLGKHVAACELRGFDIRPD